MNNQNVFTLKQIEKHLPFLGLSFFTLRPFRLDHYPLWFEVKWPSIFQSQHSLFPWKPAINLQMGVPLLLNQCFLVNCAQIKWEPFSPPPHSTRDIKLLVLCVCYFEVNLVSSNSPLSLSTSRKSLALKLIDWKKASCDFSTFVSLSAREHTSPNAIALRHFLPPELKVNIK